MIYIVIPISIVIIGCAIGLCYSVSYSRLQKNELRVKEAESLIESILQKKHSLLIRICNVIKNTVELETDYFKDINELKNKHANDGDFDRELTASMDMIIKIKSDYTKLDENPNIKDMLRELKDINEKLESLKIFFNKYTTDLNKLLRNFFLGIIAKFHNIKTRKFFATKNTESAPVFKSKL